VLWPTVSVTTTFWRPAGVLKRDGYRCRGYARQLGLARAGPVTSQTWFPCIMQHKREMFGSYKGHKGVKPNVSTSTRRPNGGGVLRHRWRSLLASAGGIGRDGQLESDSLRRRVRRTPSDSNSRAGRRVDISRQAPIAMSDSSRLVLQGTDFRSLPSQSM
jgi:hypothetical protein